jgi:hypothetical protein
MGGKSCAWKDIGFWNGRALILILILILSGIIFIVFLYTTYSCRFGVGMDAAVVN